MLWFRINTVYLIKSYPDVLNHLINFEYRFCKLQFIKYYERASSEELCYRLAEYSESHGNLKENIVKSISLAICQLLYFLSISQRFQNSSVTGTHCTPFWALYIYLLNLMLFYYISLFYLMIHVWIALLHTFLSFIYLST